MDARMHYICVSLVQNAVCTCCTYVGKCEKGLVWSDRREKLTYVKPKDAWRDRQGSASMKRFAGLSLVLASQFVARARALQRIGITWMGRTRSVGSRSVGRSVDACHPVDHASVGLAQVHPNYIRVKYFHTFSVSENIFATNKKRITVYLQHHTICIPSFESQLCRIPEIGVTLFTWFT